MSTPSRLLEALEKAKNHNCYKELIVFSPSERSVPCADVSRPASVIRMLGDQTTDTAFLVEARSSPGSVITRSSSAVSDSFTYSSYKKTMAAMPRKPLRGNTTGVLMGKSDTSTVTSPLLLSNGHPGGPALPPCKRKLPTLRKPALPIIITNSRVNDVGTAAASVNTSPSSSHKPVMTVALVSTCTAITSSPLVVMQNIGMPCTISNSSLERHSNYAVCKNCGTLTSNHAKCDSCKSKMPENPKLYAPELHGTKLMRVSSGANNASHKTGSFYKRKFVEAGYKRACQLLKGVSPNARGRGRSKRTTGINDPVCLTLSSDEEDRDCSEQNGHAAGEGASGAEDSCSQSQQEDIFPTGSLDGECTDGTTNGDADLENIQVDPLVSDNFPASLMTSSIELRCRSVRIGTYRVLLKHPVHFSFDNFSMTVPTVTNEEEFVRIQVQAKDILQVLIHYGKTVPVLFFCLTPGCGGRIRSYLKMSKREGPFYDPGSSDNVVKRVVLFPVSILRSQQDFLTAMFTEMATVHLSREGYFQQIDYKTANAILVQSSPHKVLDQLNICLPKKSAVSPSDRRSPRKPVIQQSLRLSRRECIKLATYPPQVGGITVTSDDMRCLVPGEFLNDVIIDFYLKYLFCEKLCERDRDRTHIFSSFFYKRLTNSDMPSENATRTSVNNKSTTVSSAAARHRRVKNWTRNVNIFEKDFIIIPINENSHWFLVIICFSYLVGLVGDEESCPPPSSDHDYEPIEEFLEYEEGIADESVGSNSGGFGGGGGGGDQSQVSQKEETLPDKWNDATVPGTKFDVSCDENNIQKRPCILLFDSLRTRSCWNRVFVQLREYLAVEYQEKMKEKREFTKETMRATYPAVPQQTNYSDCGLYLLQYVETFFEKPIRDFTIPIQGVHSWFSSEELARTKRSEIKSVIMRLHKDQNEQAAEQG